MWGCGVRRESLLEVAIQSRPEGGEGTAWGWGRTPRRAGEEVGGCRKDPAFTLRGSGRALPRTAQGHSPGHSHLEEQEIHLLLERRPWSPSISKDKQASCRREERRACTLTVQRPHLRACAGYEPGSRQPSPRDPRPEGTPSPDPPGAPVTRRSGHLLRAWRIRLRTHVSHSSGHQRLPLAVWTILWLFW